VWGYISFGLLEMSTRGKVLTLVLLSISVLSIMSIKAVSGGLLLPQPTVDLSLGPVLLFFNGSRGCECEVFDYQNAEAQIGAWNEESRQYIQVQKISVHKPTHLAKEYKVIRGPTLLLIDPTGQVVWRQDEVVSDIEPFDLQAFELQIRKLLNEL
jgi:hypothetical protein